MTETQGNNQKRRLSSLLGIGIFMFPYVFAWFTLRKGYSKNLRIISFGWILLLSVFVSYTNYSDKKQQEIAIQQAVKQQEERETQIREREAQIKAEEARIREKERMAFEEKRLEILSNIKQALSEKKYKKAISLSKPYLKFGDQELIKYNQEAKTAIAEFEKAVKSLVGKKVPYDKWDEWGGPETLEGTSNRYWVAYLPTANISFVSEKKSDIIIFSGFNKNSAKKFIEHKNKKRKEQLETQFSAWDGSHINLEKFIKKSMNDPGSYDHVETTYWDRGEDLIVTTTFRGKNAFGGIVKNTIQAKVSLDGQILDILE